MGAPWVLDLFADTCKLPDDDPHATRREADSAITREDENPAVTVGAALSGGRDGLSPVGCSTDDLGAVLRGRFGFVPVDERSGYDDRHPVP
jgi:hypothetical protein